MEQDIDRLYKLLPVIYRQRDAAQGMPLRALLQVIGEQVNLVEADIAQLYENWFIETCQDWVVPYIGDLVGYEVVHEAGEPGDIATSEERQFNKILIARRDVANTIHDRRRKGTLALLEQIAFDVTGWPTRAVEFYKLLGWQQNTSDIQLRRGGYVDVRHGTALDRLGGAFEQVAHTIDVRSIKAVQSQGRYGIAAVGLFVWRLKVYSVTMTRASGLENRGDEFFTFSILGNNTQLYTRAIEKAVTQRFSNELNYPTPISRRELRDSLEDSVRGGQPDDYYGEDKSLYIWTGDYVQQKGVDEEPHLVWKSVEAKNIVVANLSSWEAYRPHGSQVAVDPVLGRIVFPTNHVPEGGVRVLYHYAFSMDMGGGEYVRNLVQPAKYRLFRVIKGGAMHSIQDALHEWEMWKKRNPGQALNAVIEIMDSSVYTETRLRTTLAANETLQIRAANGKRPVIRLLDRRPDRTDALGAEGASNVKGATCSRLTLDGLLITGRGIRISGAIAQVEIRHCTLVPGWEIDEECCARWENEPSLELVNTGARVTIERSIMGAIHVMEEEEEEDALGENTDSDEPLQITITDSILDATHARRTALSAPDGELAYVKLSIIRSTVLGKVYVHAIESAENSIFMGCVRVARSQIGCMRFCYVPTDSRTPQRFNCQPDLVLKEIERKNLDDPADQDLIAERKHERDRVQPVFNSTHYGTPDYCQLAGVCAQEIVRGADDQSEMGVFHDLFQPQRAANLSIRLSEYTPARSEAGIIYSD
jgi:hypothetical protein